MALFFADADAAAVATAANDVTIANIIFDIAAEVSAFVSVMSSSCKYCC